MKIYISHITGDDGKVSSTIATNSQGKLVAVQMVIIRTAC